MRDGEICMAGVSIRFVQNGNTNGTTCDVEDLEISVESPDLIDDEGHFLVIKSTSGWSIDSAGELLRVIDAVSQSVTELYKTLNPNGGKDG